MAIDGAVSQTAVEAWDKRWATSEGRTDWLEPHPAGVAILPELRARGARQVLDLGCGVGRHALLLAEHGFDVEAIDGSPAGLAVVRETAHTTRRPDRIQYSRVNGRISFRLCRTLHNAPYRLAPLHTGGPDDTRMYDCLRA